MTRLEPGHPDRQSDTSDSNSDNEINELALFAGAGGGLLGTNLLGWTPVCAVEKAPYRREVLIRRQRDGVLPMFPIWDRIETFDGRPWRGIVDVVTAGFPCQPFSSAGKRRGEADERNMWPDTIRVIREVRPQIAYLENVPALLANRYFDRILGDLAESGYDCRWCVLSAAAVGAPHLRRRIWIMGWDTNSEQQATEFGVRGGEIADTAGSGDVPDATSVGRSEGTGRTGQGGQRGTEPTVRSTDIPEAERDGRGGIMREAGQGQDGPELRENADGESAGVGRDGAPCGEVPVAEGRGLPVLWGSQWHARQLAQLHPILPDSVSQGDGRGQQQPESGQSPRGFPTGWWSTEPDVGRVANAVAARVDRLAAIGDGQVPLSAAVAWELLMAVTPRSRGPPH